MPCRSDYMEPTTAELRTQFEQQFVHDSTLADTFCKTMQEIEYLDYRLYRHTLNFKIIDRLPPAAHVWWKAHKERDYNRIIATLERLSGHALSAAIKKLTPYERALVDAWIDRHYLQEIENENENRKQKIKKAVGKLTKEERELLGLE